MHHDTCHFQHCCRLRPSAIQLRPLWKRIAAGGYGSVIDHADPSCPAWRSRHGHTHQVLRFFGQQQRVRSSCAGMVASRAGGRWWDRPVRGNGQKA